MAALTLDRDAPAVRARSAVLHRVDVGHVEREAAVDFARTVKECLGTLDVAVAFFADGADEEDVADRFDAGAVQGAQDLEHRAQARGVIADARTAVDRTLLRHLEVRAGREDRVEVRADREHRARARAGAAADHVAGGIHHDVGEAVLAQKREHRLATDLLGEGGRLDLGDADLLGHRALHFLDAHLKRLGDPGLQGERLDALEHLRFKFRHMISHREFSSKGRFGGADGRRDPEEPAASAVVNSTVRPALWRRPVRRGARGS